MATTTNIIETALQVMNRHDWYWCMANYTNPAYGNAYNEMRTFVELVATINNAAIIKALRDLWIAKYQLVHNRCNKESFLAKEAELMNIINQAA
ncbi:hypothetical protein [Xylanibacter ruminicola]|uniref:hypothetical protein n=1 Tax=Xylanibacter ruminicola TaxID=839 RepID=UPI00049130EE|nr:hypothetical protein [Xylanibacter ruminicola]